MYQQTPSNQNNHGQIDMLEPQSRSSLDIGKTPFINNGHSYLEQFEYHFGAAMPNLLNNQQLHELVNVSNRVIEPQLKHKIQKYVSLIMHLNNISHYFIRKLENRQKRDIRDKQYTDNLLNANQIDNQKKEGSCCQSPYAALNPDKVQFEICIMLNEAQRVLQYAANCGKNIDRKLIICILNNQACFYQKVWQLQKSCSYIEAAIMNMQQWGQQSNWSQISSSNSITVHSIYSNHPIIIPRGNHSIEQDIIIMSMRRQRLPKSQGQFSTQVEMTDEQEKQKLAKNYELLSAQTTKKYSPFLQIQSEQNPSGSSILKKQKQLLHHMVKLFQLSIYYLQYSSLCGQLGHHQKSIETVKKVISKIKKVIVMNKKYYLSLDQCKIDAIVTNFTIREKTDLVNKHYETTKVSDCVELDNRKMIFGLSEINDQLPKDISESTIQNYRQAARFYLKQYESIHTMCPIRQSGDTSMHKKSGDTSMHKKSESTKNKKIQQLHERLTGMRMKNEKFSNEQSSDRQLQMKKIREQVKYFSISDILQIKSQQYKYRGCLQQRYSDLSKSSGRATQQESKKSSQPISVKQTHKQISAILRYLPAYLFEAKTANKNPSKNQNSQETAINMQLLNYKFITENILLNNQSVHNQSINPIEYPFLISIALLLSSSYFILATQLRLQAAKDQSSEGQRFHKQIYKQSELYHLIAILVLAIYVPLQMNYLRHMVASYQNYYVRQLSPIDQMKNNQYENGPNQNINVCYCNISLRNKFDKQCIYKYPKVPTKKQKQLLCSIKKVLKDQIDMPLLTESRQISTIKQQLVQKQEPTQKRSVKSGRFKDSSKMLKNQKIQVQMQISARKMESQHYSQRSQQFQQLDSQDKFYENLFDLEKRNQIQANLRYKQPATNKSKLKKSSKSSSQKKKLKRQSISPINNQSANKNSKRNINLCIKRVKKTLINSAKTVKLSVSSKKDHIDIQKNYKSPKGSLYNIIDPGTINTNPKKLQQQFRKQQLNSKKYEMINCNEKSSKKQTYHRNVYSASHSITMIPDHTAKCHNNDIRYHATNKNSVMEANNNKLGGMSQRQPSMNFGQDKQKKRKKNRKLSKQLRFRNIKISEYKMNTQRARKSSGRYNTYTYNSRYGSRQKNGGTKSKSRSQDRIKKASVGTSNNNEHNINLNNHVNNGMLINDRQTSYGDVEQRVQQTMRMKKQCKQGDDEMYGEQSESDPDVYRINVNRKKKKEPQFKNINNVNSNNNGKLKKSTKKQRRNSRIGSPMGNTDKNSANTKCSHAVRQTGKIAGTTSSSYLTTTPNSVGVKSPPARRVFN